MGGIELNELLSVTGLKVSTYPEDTLYRLNRIEELKGSLKEMVTGMRIVESAVTSRWVECRVMQSQIEGAGVTVQESEDALELAVEIMHEGCVGLINECVQEVRNEKKEET